MFEGDISHIAASKLEITMKTIRNVKFFGVNYKGVSKTKKGGYNLSLNNHLCIFFHFIKFLALKLERFSKSIKQLNLC
jgi:hypothetical protein